MVSDCIFTWVYIEMCICSSLCEVEDPGCIWGLTVDGPGVQARSPQDYGNLQVKMNLFYRKVNLDVQNVKPSSLQTGQVRCTAMNVYKCK